MTHLEFHVNAKQIKSLIAIMKEFLDMVVFHFHRDQLIITGCDADKVALLQTIIVNETPDQMFHHVYVAAPLLEIYKFLRGCSDKEQILFTVEALTELQCILAGRIRTVHRNSWYRFSFVAMPLDVVNFDPTHIDVVASYVLPTKSLLRGVREIVHSHSLVRIRLQDGGVVLETFDKDKPGAGGGKVRFAQETPSTTSSSGYNELFLVRYIQKFIRIVPTLDLQVIFPRDSTQPLQLVATHHQHSIRLVLAPYTEE